MSLFYYGFIAVLIFIFVIVLVSWYSVYESYTDSSTTHQDHYTALPLPKIPEKQRGYLTIASRDSLQAFAFSPQDGHLYLTTDKNAWQEFIYMEHYGLVDATTPRNVLAYFNSMVTLAPPANSRYTQTSKITANNIILDLGKRKYTLKMDGDKLDIAHPDEDNYDQFLFLVKQSN